MLEHRLLVDSLVTGRRICALAVVDNSNRACLAITVDQSLQGEDVVATMENIKSMQGAAKRFQVDNCGEFISKVRPVGV